MEPSSWIVDLRRRLDTPPPRRLDIAGDRHAALVALYVEAGQLWVLLSRVDDADHRGGAAFPSDGLAAAEEPWAGARRAAAGLDVDSGQMMLLGQLDEVVAPTGEILVPCVAVIPPPGEGAPTGTDAAETRSWTGLPLIAARHPSLIEERALELEGREVWIRIAHIGPLKLAGAGVEILDSLLGRVFDA